MKNLFDPILVEQTKRRILELRAESARQWGSMEVAPTLAHCTSGIEMAMGVIQAKRAPFPPPCSARLSSHSSSATTSRCAATRLRRRNCSQRIRRSASSRANAPGSSPPSIAFPVEARRAAPVIPTLSSAHSIHNSGPSSCTSTSTIICDSSAFKEALSVRSSSTRLPEGALLRASGWRQLRRSA